MRCWLILALALAGGPPVQAAPARILILDLQTTSVDRAVVDTLGAGIAARVGRQRSLTVVSGAELRRMADLAAEQSAAGCDDDVVCLAELAGAMGADYVVFGDINRVGALHVVTLGVFDPQGATVLARETVREASLEALPALLDQRVDRLLTRAELVAPPAGAGAVPVVVAVSSGAVVVAGLVAIGVGLLPIFDHQGAAARVEAARNQAEADTALADVTRAQQAHNSWGLPSLIGGGVAVVAGIAGVVGGVVWAVSNGWEE